jgi:hypothetical protein
LRISYSYFINEKLDSDYNLLDLNNVAVIHSCGGTGQTLALLEGCNFPGGLYCFIQDLAVFKIIARQHIILHPFLTFSFYSLNQEVKLEG